MRSAITRNVNDRSAPRGPGDDEYPSQVVAGALIAIDFGALRSTLICFNRMAVCSVQLTNMIVFGNASIR